MIVLIVLVHCCLDWSSIYVHTGAVELCWGDLAEPSPSGQVEMSLVLVYLGRAFAGRLGPRNVTKYCGCLNSYRCYGPVFLI